MKDNKFYKSLKEHMCCGDEYGEYEGHDNIRDMHKYRNSDVGALDYVHYGDQAPDGDIKGHAGDAPNDFDVDVKLDDPQLSPEAKRVMGSINTFAKFIGEDISEIEIDEDVLEEEYVSGEITENISQFDMFMDSLFLSIADSYESKPSMWRSTKRLADRMDEETFMRIIERKVKDDTFAAAFKSIHKVLITEDF